MNFGGRFNARHARKADDVVGFQTGQAVVGISGKAAALGSCTTPMLPGAGAGPHLYRSVRAGEIGPDLFHAACRRDLEGLMSKRRDPYQAGRSKHWVKGNNPAAPARRREGRRPKLGAAERAALSICWPTVRCFFNYNLHSAP